MTRVLEIYVGASTYNRYGGQVTLSLLGDFLMLGAPDFGDAIKEIELILRFNHSGPPRKTLESMFESFHANQSSMPLVTYRRSKGRMEIAAASDLMDGRDLDRSRQLSLDLFKRGFDAVLQAMSLMRKRLKKSDAFDLDSFLAHCESARRRLPATDGDLQQIATELKASAKIRREALSPWEKLGIDWEDYHPKAREILDDPFLWDSSHEFAPNGNDTGADLLEAYRDWLKKHRVGRPMEFLEHLARRWGYADLQAMDEETLDESAIGLAFAEIKLRGQCDDEVRALALKSIERQCEIAERSVDWSHRGERLKTLKMMALKIPHV